MFKLLGRKIGKSQFEVMDVIVLLIVSAIALYIRLIFVELKFPDYTICLKPWVDAFREYGGFAGLGHEIGNYTPAYMHLLMLISYFDVEPLYVIKAVSIALDFVLAIIGSMLLTTGMHKYKKILTYIIILMLPTVIANSGVWGQCDNIYTIFILCALYCALKEVSKTIKVGKIKLTFQTDDFVMFFLGCAFAFKLQTVFLLPVIAVLCIKRNYRLRTFLWIFVVYGITLIPSWIAGRGVVDMLTIYFRQTKDFNELQLEFPNMYSFWQFEGLDKEIGNMGIWFCGLGLVLLVYYLYQKKITFDVRFLCTFTTLSVLFITYFLPHMHDRYAYIAEVTSVYFLLDGDKKKMWIPVVLNLIALESYSETLFWFSFEGFNIIGALLRLVVIIVLAYDLMAQTKEREEGSR
ncbi:MAG: hypothetical protein E7289_02960 [Lachnospiraceae bacterium]|nr:hypothetical protein [Lachnospiraceae bacterium]